MQSIFVYIIITAAVIYAVVALFRAARKIGSNRGCGGDCDGCGSNCNGCSDECDKKEGCK